MLGPKPALGRARRDGRGSPSLAVLGAFAVALASGAAPGASAVGRRSRCCPAGPSARGGAGGRAARPRRPGAGPARRRQASASTAKTAIGAERLEPLQCSIAWAWASFSEPSGIAITTSAPRLSSSPQPTSGGSGRGRRRRRSPPRDRDHLRDPEAGRPGAGRGTRARSRARQRAPATAARTVARRPSSSAAQFVGLRCIARRLAQPDHLFQHLAAALRRALSAQYLITRKSRGGGQLYVRSLQWPRTSQPEVPGPHKR